MKNVTALLALWMALLSQNRVIAQAHHRLIIQEIMADPTPAVALPAYEWIEIKNNSKEIIALQNWRFIAGSSVSSPLPIYFLAPDSLVILCNTVAQGVLSKYGKTVGLSSFPSLSNEGETISLRDPTGKTVHAVTQPTGMSFPGKRREAGAWNSLILLILARSKTIGRPVNTLQAERRDKKIKQVTPQ